MPDEWRTGYLGGTALAYRYLLENLAQNLEPFDPESAILLMTGPLAGTLMPTSSRMAVAARSPISEEAASGVVACGAAAGLKFAGYDGVIISGRASAPGFLYITEQRVTFERANLLWGKGAHETEKTIQQKKWTHQAKTLAIGPAGENLAPNACVVADGVGQAGSTGIGAVMGSKNLKAVAVRGHAGVHVSDLEGLMGLLLGAFGDGSRNDWRRWSDAFATAENAVGTHGPDMSPGPDFATDRVRRSGSSAFLSVETQLMLARVCVSCPLGRFRSTTAGDGERGQGPSLCTIGNLGTKRDIAGLDRLVSLSRLCDDLGLDTVSTADAIGFGAGATEEDWPGGGPHAGLDDKTASAVNRIAFAEDTAAKKSQAVVAVGTGYDNEAAILDSIILCSMWRLPLETVAEAMTLVTGVRSTIDGLREVGNSILELERRAVDHGIDAGRPDEDTV
ncbi:MAG: hypothetical protein M1370_06120 [Bacteroidetes bacterium]|nr:hypothetical protein [Bacteroidota bacterium]